MADKDKETPKEDPKEPERDLEAEAAAHHGALRHTLEKMGVPAEASKDWTAEECLGKLNDIIAQQKRREEKGKSELADLRQAIEGFGGRLEEAIAMPKPQDPPEPEADPHEGDEVVRKSAVAVAAAEVQPSAEDDVPDYETKSMLERYITGGISFAPSVKMLLEEPMDYVADFVGVPERQLKALRMANDRLFLTACIVKQSGFGRQAHLRGMPIPEVVKGLESWRAFRGAIESNAALQKAMDTAESGAGADWIPTGFSAELLDRVALQLRVAALFDPVPMPTDPYELPMRGSRPTAYLAAESTADSATALTASDAGTASPQLDAVKLAVRVLFSDELTEDSVIPILPYVEEEVVGAIAYGEENACVNGDTQSTHFDTGYTVASGDVRRSWIGLRRTQNQQTPTAAAVDLSSTNFTAANLLAIKGEMGNYGAIASDGAWVTSVLGLVRMMGLTQTLTLERYGPRATILAGELAQAFGSPVIVSEHVGANLNAAGIYDGCTTDNTIILYVHKPSFVRGQRSSNVESDRIVETQQTQVVAVKRAAFVSREAAATVLMVGLGHDVGST